MIVLLVFRKRKSQIWRLFKWGSKDLGFLSVSFLGVVFCLYLCDLVINGCS